MERMKQVKNRQVFQQTNRKLLCPFEKSSKAIKQGLGIKRQGIKKDQRAGLLWGLRREPQPEDKASESLGCGH